MTIEGLKRLLDHIAASDTVVVDDSPNATRVTTSTVTGEPDNEVLCITWTDEKGWDFEVKFTEAGFRGATIAGNEIALPDHEGEPTTLYLYDLAPRNARPPMPNLKRG